jgi:uncharacterized membrane protein HdeD (DUF308 family)
MAPGADEAASVPPRLVGPLLILAGLVLLIWPAATTRVLASLVGLGAVVYGMHELTRLYRGHGEHLEFSAGMIGLLSVFGGVVIVVTPFVSETATGTIIGAYWLIAGAVEVIGAFLRPVARLERLLVGGLSVGAGALVLVLPSTSIVVFVWFAGGWLLAAGAIVTLLQTTRRPRRAVA